MAAVTPVVGTNSYVTNADAITYHEDSIHGTGWVGEAEDNQNKALNTAYRMIERQDYKGDRTTPGQTQKWPRSGLTDEEGVAVPSGSVPQFVIDAQCEIALALIEGSTIQTGDAGSNIKELDADGTSITYFRPEAGSRFPLIVDELLGFYLEGSGALDGFFYPVANATDTDDNASGISDHSLTGGY